MILFLLKAPSPLPLWSRPSYVISSDQFIETISVNLIHPLTCNGRAPPWVKVPPPLSPSTRATGSYIHATDASSRPLLCKFKTNGKNDFTIMLLLCFVLPATLHGGDGLPRVASYVQTFAARHAHRSVVATHAVQHVVQRGHGTATAPAAHGRHGHPFAHPGVVPLDGRLVVGRVETTQSVQTVVCKGGGEITNKR